MNVASALLQSAESHGITLWVDREQLRYKSLAPVSEGMKDRIRQHKAEIIQLLNDQGDGPGKPRRPPLPDWCNPGCECFCRLELPGLVVVQGCYQEADEKNWKWSRIDKMTCCPQTDKK